MPIAAENKKTKGQAGLRQRQQVDGIPVVIILFLVAIIVPVAGLAAWVEPVPSSAPPGYSGSGRCQLNPDIFCVTDGNCPTPGDSCQEPELLPLLTGSGITQQKLGSLILGDLGGNSTFCLNASASGTNDVMSCVSNWTEAIGLAGNFLKLTPPPADGTQLTNYTVSDTGYFRLQASAAKHQLYSLMAEAGPTNDSRGLYAADAVTPSTTYAGYFSGRVVIDNSTHNTFLCLNETDLDLGNAKGCIDSWIDALAPPGSAGLVSLQAGPSYTSDVGKSGVSGTGFMGSAATGSTLNLPLAVTCGDGICSTNTNPAETPTSCLIDCSLPPPPSIQVFPGNGRIFFTVLEANLPPECPGWPGCTTGNLLIVRRLGAPPTFIPQQGTDYTGSADPGTGQYYGDNYVVFARPADYGTACGGAPCPITDLGLTNGQTYYYHVYQGTQYPRFGSPAVTFIQPAVGPPGPPQHLAVTLVGGGAVTGAGISCTEADLTNNVVLPSTQQGTDFTGWESPTPTSILRSNPSPGQGFSGSVLRWEAVGSDNTRRDWARTAGPSPDAHTTDFLTGLTTRISFQYRSAGSFSIRDRDAIIANVPSNIGPAQTYTLDYTKSVGGWADPRLMVYLGTTAAWVEMDDLQILPLPDCDEDYSTGTSVTLDAEEVSNPEWAFVGWGGDCAFFNPNPICTLTMLGPQNVSASYAPL